MKMIFIPCHVQDSPDRRALWAIAGVLQSDASDFRCIDAIVDIVEQRGLPTAPRHDFG